MKQKPSLISFSLSIIGMLLVFIAWGWLKKLLYVHENVFFGELPNMQTAQLSSILWIGGGLCVLAPLKDLFLAGRKRTILNVVFLAGIVGLVFYWAHVFSDATFRVLVGPENSSRITIAEPRSCEGCPEWRYQEQPLKARNEEADDD
ncbi:MAG: hypothetical protein GX804_11795 [Lentisphaerae bacterium]|jgi:hypothetical protein|nr:hypothetical protein [Lentisphaerota bacterium]